MFERLHQSVATVAIGDLIELIPDHHTSYPEPQPLEIVLLNIESLDADSLLHAKYTFDLYWDWLIPMREARYA